jgi:hypothetical protein
VEDRLSIVALAVAALALVVVLFTPAPAGPPRRPRRATERTALLVDGEARAAASQHKELSAIEERIGVLRSRLEDSSARKAPDAGRTVRQLAEAEITRRWGELKKGLDTLKLYEERRRGNR